MRDADLTDLERPELGEPEDLSIADSGSPADRELADAGASDLGVFADATSPMDLGAPSDAGRGPVASQLMLTIDRDIDPDPTPINQLYLAEIQTTTVGDRIALLQKYFRNPAINTALVEAARRGVQVVGVYGDDVDPSCESLLQTGDTIDCDTMFQRSIQSHHKNMMILKSDGRARGIVGSYNLRERSTDSPRVHTVASFEVANGQGLFDYYYGEVERLTGSMSTQPKQMSVPISGGGVLDFTFHPHPSNTVLELLNDVTTCRGTLWLSFYGALADSVGRPVFDRLGDLHDGGCDVRVLLDPGATLAELSLRGRGVPVQFPEFPFGDGTLGHKIALAHSGGETQLIQSSANLSGAHFNILHNLSLRIRAPSLPFAAELEAELLRYW